MRNQDRNAKIIRDVESGLSFTDAANKYGVSRSCVAGILDRHRRPWRAIKRDELARQYGDREAARKAPNYWVALRSTAAKRLRELAEA